MAKTKLILVADDQPNIRLTLEYLLRSMGGVRVATACNGQEALEQARRDRPALVLLDVMMPRMDGYAACQAIRQAWGDYAGQIWFITARGSKVELEQARAAGADRCITKPFDPDGLVDQIRAALELAPVRAGHQAD